MTGIKIFILTFAAVCIYCNGVNAAYLYTEDFETAGSLPVEWNFGSYGSCWEIDSSIKASGNTSIKLNLPEDISPSSNIYAYSSQFNVQPGQLVKISGFIRTEDVYSSSKYTASIQLVGTNTNEILAEGALTNEGFIYLEKVAVLSEYTSTVRIYLRGYGRTGQIWFDDIKVESVELPKPIDKDLSGWWRLDGNLIDSSVQRFDLNSVGSGGSPIINNSGYTGKCYYFDNINSGAQVFYPGAIDINDYEGISFTAWVKPSVLLGGFSAISPHTIARFYYSANNDNILDFRIRDGKLDVYYTNPVANNFTDFNLPLNEWSFVAVTQSGTNLTVYMNDQKKDFVVNGGMNYNRLLIGSPASSSARGLNGFLDEIRFYKRALSEDEIRDIRGNADLNRDRVVDYKDLAVLNINRPSQITAAFVGDINYDGEVDKLDFDMLSSQWLEAY